MSNYTISEKTDLLTKHLTSDKIKGRLEKAISLYQEGKESPADLLDIKDEFNQLGFYLGELVCKAKDIYNAAQLETQRIFNENYIKERGAVDENTNKLQAVETCKYKARLRTSAAYSTEYASEYNYMMAREYRDTCKNYRDNANQRVAVLRDDLFSSRQQV